MLKKLYQIILIIIFLTISFCIYLSVYGINTDKLNGIINEKISQRDSDFDIKLNKIKIFLDIGSFKLEAKTKNPIIFYKKNKIELQSISTALPLLSIFTQEAKMENLKLITKKNKVKDLIEFGRGFQNTPQLFILKKMVKSGDISVEAKINFCVLEEALTGDFALISANKADRFGNVNFSYTQMNFGPIMATACTTTIVEARLLLEEPLPHNHIQLPSVYVDYLIESEEKEHGS